MFFPDIEVKKIVLTVLLTLCNTHSFPTSEKLFISHMTLMSFGLVLPDDEGRTACLNKLVCAPFDIPRTCAHTHTHTHTHTYTHNSDRDVFSFMAANER